MEDYGGARGAALAESRGDTTPQLTRALIYPSAAIELLQLGYCRQLGDVRRESKMRWIALAMLVATGYGLVGASGASAAPASGAAIAELGHLVDQVMQVRDSCGRGRHRSSGRCAHAHDASAADRHIVARSFVAAREG
jgi:hypothetical protein